MKENMTILVDLSEWGYQEAEERKRILKSEKY
jgi:hypothetical protein